MGSLLPCHESQWCWNGISVRQLLTWFLTPRLPERQVWGLSNKRQWWQGQDLGWTEAWD